MLILDIQSNTLGRQLPLMRSLIILLHTGVEQQVLENDELMAKAWPAKYLYICKQVNTIFDVIAKEVIHPSPSFATEVV